MNPYNRPEYKHKREVILFIFDYSCVLCNHKSAKNNMHHIDEEPLNCDSYNLIVLCKSCHINVHKLSIVINYQYSNKQILLLNQLNSNFVL